jgi:hypothetical protein
MKKLVAFIVLSCVAFGGTVYAYDVTGTVDLLEVWNNGNVAFTLNPPASYCNNQFILNGSSASGAKNQFAAVLTAKTTGKQLRISYYGCGPADNYGGNYIIPSYIYVQDN